MLEVWRSSSRGSWGSSGVPNGSTSASATKRSLTKLLARLAELHGDRIGGLYLPLSRTKVQGLGLARLKSLPRLSILYLDGSEMTEDGLKALSGATSLETLSLSGVPLSDEALPRLKAIPRLNRLETTGCGFLDGEVGALVKSKPGLTIIRR